MHYEEALGYLRQLSKFGFRFGLERITELLSRLGNPHHRLRVIHIGGTNGKGSTAAMTSSILQAAGLRVGLFTSPHLHQYTERMQINGRQISRETVARLLTVMHPVLQAMTAAGGEHPTEFEVNTALAFLYFAEEEVDLAVIEVGLGGTIDATNVVRPLVSVITNVGRDHTDCLGHRLPEIAREKAGIIKEQSLVVTAADRPEVLEVLQEVCRIRQATLIRVGREVTWVAQGKFAHGQYLQVRGQKRTYDRVFVPFWGRHQLANAATAIAAVEALARFHLDISMEAVSTGLATTRWPARLEVLREKPQIVVDVAHNADGARVLREALLEFFTYRRLILVIGMLADKDRAQVVATLAPLAAVVMVTRPNSPRAGDWEVVAEEATKYVPEVRINPQITSIVPEALALATDEDLVCITGSMFLVAEARAWLVDCEKFRAEQKDSTEKNRI
jgi:dihydrofolate synthase/folylpolyglutamate synthase